MCCRAATPLNNDAVTGASQGLETGKSRKHLPHRNLAEDPATRLNKSDHTCDIRSAAAAAGTQMAADGILSVARKTRPPGAKSNSVPPPNCLTISRSIRRRAETLVAPCCDARAAAFTPCQRNRRLCRISPPRRSNQFRSCRSGDRQRTVFCGVGGEFVDHHADGRGDFGFQIEIGALEARPARSARKGRARFAECRGMRSHASAWS